MKRVIPLLILGTLIIENPAFSMPGGAYNQIMQAVYTRDEAALKYLISVGLNVNATNLQGKTALCTAVENQDYEGYELLLSQGATTRTPCIRNMSPEILARFQAEQPPLGTYYDGAVLTASRNGALSGVGKEVGATIAGLPYPHLGEILLGGVAVGTVFAIGAHGGGGGGDDPDPEAGKYASPFDNSKTTASNYLSPTYFSAPTADTLSKTQKGGIPGATSALAKKYASEYSGGSWSIEHTNFLKLINASSAYARGYSGLMINRDAEGKPSAMGWDAVSDDKIKVAVMDNGLFYNTDLNSSLFETTSYSSVTYYGSKGKNYVYGTNTSLESPYWTYDPSTEKATLNNVSESVTVSFKQKEWDEYEGKFAHICSGTGDSNCLTTKKTIEDNRYIVYYVKGSYDSSVSYNSSNTAATYYVLPYLWDQYVAKYGESGYVYDAEDATGMFFQTKDTNGDLTGIDHGTHVTGLISALRNGQGMQGVAYNADIIPIKLDLDTGETLNHISDAVSTGARIVNLSIGKQLYVTNDKSTNEILWDVLGYANNYRAAADNNVALIFAAGNESQAQPSINTVAPLVDSAYKNLLISVVALGNNSRIASYSNRCGATASYCLTAPGGDSEALIISTGLAADDEDYYSAKGGTSMAAPIVSGSLAVVMGAFPFLTTQEAVQILLDTAKYVKPTSEEITAYNVSAEDSNAYSVNTVDGKYNAIYGRGLVDLAAATDPIGLPKITFDSVASSQNAVTAASSSAYVSPVLANSLKVLPKKLIVLDDYTRAYQVSTKNFIRSEKRKDALRRSFRSFMAHDEKEVHASDEISFAFSEAPTDKKDVYTGAMSVVMRPNKNIKMRLGFVEDTASFGGSYTGRSLQNPFMNMREALGVNASVTFAKNWSLMGNWYTGKNGFIDEDVFDRMSKQARMNLIESGVAYRGIKNITLGILGGIMNEEESLFGTRGAGAFKTDGAQTRFVRVMANYQPSDKFRLSGAYTYGMTESNGTTSLMNISELKTDSFAITAEYMPDEKQTFGLKLMSPLRVRSGHVAFDLPVARDMYEDKVYREVYRGNLKPDAREYDLSLFYANEISPELSLAGETGVRLNPDHQKDVAPDYRALFKLNWIW